jgi:hypothetical protein
VVMDLLVGDNIGENEFQNPDIRFSYQNPVKENISLHIFAQTPLNLTFIINDIQGQQLFRKMIPFESSEYSISFPVEFLHRGIYFLQIYCENKFVINRKIMKL